MPLRLGNWRWERVLTPFLGPGVFKPAHGKARIFRVDGLNRRWKAIRSDDSALVSAIVAELSEYDIWVAHNGARFDVPFLRTQLAKWGLDPLPSKKLVDPVQLARYKLRMSFNSLAAIANFLGFNSKTEVKGTSSSQVPWTAARRRWTISWINVCATCWCWRKSWAC